MKLILFEKEFLFIKIHVISFKENNQNKKKLNKKQKQIINYFIYSHA